MAHTMERRNLTSENGNLPKGVNTLVKVCEKASTRDGGETIKFTCHHCNTTYTGSYTHLREHLYGIMPSDEESIEAKT